MKPASPVLTPLVSLAKARRHRMIAIAIAGGIALLLVLAGLAALLDTWLAWRSPVRMVLVAALVTAAFVYLVKRLSRVRRFDAMESARMIEAAHPEVGQRLRTALDVAAKSGHSGSPEAAFFTDRLMRETGKTLEFLPLRRLVPKRELVTRLTSAAAAFAVIVTAALLWGDFRHAVKRLVFPNRDLTYTRIEWKSLPNGFDEAHPPRLEFGIAGRGAQPELQMRQGGGAWKPVELTRRTDGRTWDVVFTGKTTDIEVKVIAGDATQEVKRIPYRPIPKLTDSSATVAFPDYTGLKNETTPGGDVRCVEGSTATWNFTFNTPPHRVVWNLGGTNPVELVPEQGTAKFSVSTEVKAGKLQGELAIFHADGERIDAWRFDVNGVIDKLPQVEIVEPGKDLSLISTAEMPIRIRAKDDFGVAEIGLILDAGGERKWVAEKVLDARDQRQVSELAAMMLDQIPLKITDNVRIHAYALDHKPRGGPRAVSPLRSVDIRQFQMRWYFAGGGGGGEDEEKPDSEAVSNALMKLDEIIGSQRGILSDVFGTKESFRSGLPPEVLQKAEEYCGRELNLGSESKRVAFDWSASGDLPADDIALMGAAAAQMTESGGFLGAPDLAKGFTSADRALATLLQLRKKLITIIGRGKSKDPKPMENPPVPLTDLAKEARRIAGEEKDVASQITPETIGGNDIKSTRRQQEVALADTGELYAKLVDHPERNEGSLKLMDDSEKAVSKADKTLNTDAPANAAPELAVAERDLLDLAVFLESMDLEKLSDTLRKLADNAEKSAGEQKKPGSAGGKGEGQAAADAARTAGLANKILDELAKKAGGPQPDADAAKTPEAATLEALKKQADAAALAKDLEKLARLQKDGAAREAGELEGDTTRRLGELAREYRDAAAGLDANRLAELAKAREQAAALKKALAQQKPGKGQGEGKNPGENGKGATASKNGKGEGEGQGKGDKPGNGGEGAIANKDGKGQEEAGKQEKGIDGAIANKNAKDPDNTKAPGDKPGNGGGGDDGQPGNGGPTLHRFADTLERLNDKGGVGRMVFPLRAAPFDRSAIPLVDAADRRLLELIDQVPTDSHIASARGKPPESSRREIEDYFRDLSDDFGGEVWEDNP